MLGQDSETKAFDVELHSAEESRSTATNKSYLLDVERQAIAAQINTAANSGELRCIYQQNISDEMKSELESKGYVITRATDDERIPQFIISWKA